ncbi:MAG: DNA polymerase IV [Clostridiales bacterium]|nr:DNA polymerase IV [Clostridiales bacterium]
MSERTILHCEMDCFYASVEMLHHPELEGKPLAVVGDPDARHGIVLTANYKAKKTGVKTGMALWQAKQLCPEIAFLPPRMDLYLRFSGMAREIYSEYTNQIEPYGIDEAWLDVTDSSIIKGDGIGIAGDISKRIRYELGITVSIGVSWNKIYAKLGSDYNKPDAITWFHRGNYKDIIWRLPLSDLLYVGRQTSRKLYKLGIYTIGQLAQMDEKILESHLGKMGLVLWTFANGYDEDPVCAEGYEAPIKSIGNSTTTPRDLETDTDVWIILTALSESVSARLRKHGFKCNVVEIWIRDIHLNSITRQIHISQPTNITDEIVNTAFQLFRKHYQWEQPIRSLGVRASSLVMEDVPVQLDLFENQAKREKMEKLDCAVDEIRRRFGYFSIQRAVMYQDKILSHLDAGKHKVHPHSYFHG